MEMEYEPGHHIVARHSAGAMMVRELSVTVAAEGGPLSGRHIQFVVMLAAVRRGVKMELQNC
jgi:hypothetical protein